MVDARSVIGLWPSQQRKDASLEIAATVLKTRPSSGASGSAGIAYLSRKREMTDDWSPWLILHYREIEQNIKEAKLAECHCGKNGHALNSVNCPVHGYRIVRQSEYDALNAFDAENKVEPARTIAERIAWKYGAGKTHSLVDDIAHAIEDAMEWGQKRGRLIPTN